MILCCLQRLCINGNNPHAGDKFAGVCLLVLIAPDRVVILVAVISLSAASPAECVSFEPRMVEKKDEHRNPDDCLQGDI